MLCRFSFAVPERLCDFFPLKYFETMQQEKEVGARGLANNRCGFDRNNSDYIPRSKFGNPGSCVKICKD